jgi:hypothetical protein
LEAVLQHVPLSEFKLSLVEAADLYVALRERGVLAVTDIGLVSTSLNHLVELVLHPPAIKKPFMELGLFLGDFRLCVLDHLEVRFRDLTLGLKTAALKYDDVSVRLEVSKLRIEDLIASRTAPERFMLAKLHALRVSYSSSTGKYNPKPVNFVWSHATQTLQF